MKITKLRKKPNCKQGNVACGKRCQPKHYKCPSEKGIEVSEASDKFVDNIMVVSASAVTTTLAPSLASNSTTISSLPERAATEDVIVAPELEIPEALSKLFSIFNGEKDFEKIIEEIESTDGPEFTFPDKINNSKVNNAAEVFGESLSQKEILSIVRWTSATAPNYKPLNEVLYDWAEAAEYENERREYGRRTGILLASALRKLKGGKFTFSRENLEKSEDYDNLRSRADGKITRSLNIPLAQMDSFLGPYREALESGSSKEIRERTFAAATANTELYGESSSVEIEYEPLENGKSSAIMLEAIKPGFEGEVMFPPGARFEVREVKKKEIEDFIPKVSISASNLGIIQPRNTEEAKVLIKELEAKIEEIEAAGLADYDSNQSLNAFYRFKKKLEMYFIELDFYASREHYKVILREIPDIQRKEAEAPRTLEEYYNNSLALFSKESKAERRAKIKGQSNEKELKKIQLREENEAWIFVRLKRELDRLEKKGGEAKNIAELKDLLSRILDGDTSAKAEGKERVEGRVKKKEEKIPSVSAATALDKIVEIEVIQPEVVKSPEKPKPVLKPKGAPKKYAGAPSVKQKNYAAIIIGSMYEDPAFVWWQSALEGEAKDLATKVLDKLDDIDPRWVIENRGRLTANSIRTEFRKIAQELGIINASSKTEAVATTPTSTPDKAIKAEAEAEIFPVNKEKLASIKKSLLTYYSLDLFPEETTSLNLKEIAEKRIESSSKKRVVYGYDSPVAKSNNNITEVAKLLRGKADGLTYSDDELKTIFSLANEYILLSSGLENTKDIEITKAYRKLLYAINKEPLTAKKISGNSEARGKKSIPPLPTKFKKSDSEPVEESFRNFLEEASILVQVTPDALESILIDGRFKNKFESGSVDSISEEWDDAETYRKKRLSIEEQSFGISKKASSDQRPIYGYIESPDHLKSADITNDVNLYGAISIKLKDTVKERSTITIGDSFGSGKPTPMLAPTKEVYKSMLSINSIEAKGPSVRDLEVKGFGFGGVSMDKIQYIETQIFGGINLSDIDFIILPAWIIRVYPSIIELLGKEKISYQIK